MEYNIRIANVREVPSVCHISRWERMRYAGGEIAVTLASKFIPHPEIHTISLRLTTTYCHMRSMMRHTILRYCIEMDFELEPEGMPRFDNGKGIDLPPRLMMLMYGPAVGALRGMLAIRTANTFLQEYPLPLINISALVSAHVNGSQVPDGIVPLTDFHYS